MLPASRACCDTSCRTGGSCFRTSLLRRGRWCSRATERGEPMQIRRMLIAGTALLVPLSARAQTSTLDEGAFRLMVDGREVGTETFSIRQSGEGDRAVVIAQGRVVLANG